MSTNGWREQANLSLSVCLCVSGLLHANTWHMECSEKCILALSQYEEVRERDNSALIDE